MYADEKISLPFSSLCHVRSKSPLVTDAVDRPRNSTFDRCEIFFQTEYLFARELACPRSYWTHAPYARESISDVSYFSVSWQLALSILIHHLHIHRQTFRPFFNFLVLRRSVASGTSRVTLPTRTTHHLFSPFCRSPRRFGFIIAPCRR